MPPAVERKAAQFGSRRPAVRWRARNLHGIEPRRARAGAEKPAMLSSEPILESDHAEFCKAVWLYTKGEHRHWRPRSNRHIDALGDAIELRTLIYLEPLLHCRRWRELGMPMALRYLVTVRRATLMPAAARSFISCSSLFGCFLSSLSISS